MAWGRRGKVDEIYSLADRVGDKGADLVGGQGELCVGIITEEGIFRFNHQLSIILMQLEICAYYLYSLFLG